ncbi:MAG: biotin--[acetyl-CoA-carboxylase] ligase [Bacteroidales bacterium]|nr:biotin--[acetyl-CoA-carboxylase] ligase [Bacteroidales bacterium]
MTKQLPIRWLEETDSTQNELARHISDYDNLSVVAARYQTAGRGQRGNSWVAAKGENLTFSMLLKFGQGRIPYLDSGDQFKITRAATLGVLSYLHEKGIPCKIKWPNDIYYRNRKICGMLIENVLDGRSLKHSIIGIGLNLNQKAFPAELVNPVSMSLLTGIDYDPEKEMEILYSNLTTAFSLYLAPGSDSSIYEENLYRMGEFHEYVRCSDGTTFEARIIGVNKLGQLQVQNKKGERETFAFKEISYII